MAKRKASADVIGLPTDGPWPDDAVRKLKTYVAANWSYARMARKLKRTRNQVIGKVHRLGLREPTTRERLAADNSLVMQIAAANRHRSQPFKGRPVKSKAWAPDSVVALAELAEDGCRWPVGEPKAEGFGFCGCTKAGGYPYCDTHVRAAYVAAPEEGDEAVAVAA